MIAPMFCVVTAMLAGAALCQAPPASRDGDLEPIASALTDPSPDYHLKLREILMRKAPAKCDLQFMVLPSFQPETLLLFRPL